MKLSKTWWILLLIMPIGYAANVTLSMAQPQPPELVVPQIVPLVTQPLITATPQATATPQGLTREITTYGSEEAVLWQEGDSLTEKDEAINQLAAYAEDTYNLFLSLSNGDYRSWDGADAVMKMELDGADVGCPNAQWTTEVTQFCTGMTSDDSIAHEWTHAYTQTTHELGSTWQFGSLSEGYSDIFGEVVDRINNGGLDAPDTPRTPNSCSIHGQIFTPTFIITEPAELVGIYEAGGATFNPRPPVSVISKLVLGESDGGLTDACQPFADPVSINGNIVLADRGSCSFEAKALQAQNAGAVGLVVINRDDEIIKLNGDMKIDIPTTIIKSSDGAKIRDALPNVEGSLVISANPDVDDDSLRWLIGEDVTALLSPFRDMYNPTCFDDPGKVSDEAYKCSYFNRGGTHDNSGVINHGFALLADGGDYNGQQISGIGLTKAAHIYWRAMSAHQTKTTDFNDHADALVQACTDLIWQPLTALRVDGEISIAEGEVVESADCDQVDAMIAAVELRADETQCTFDARLGSLGSVYQLGGATASLLADQWSASDAMWPQISD